MEDFFKWLGVRPSSFAISLGLSFFWSLFSVFWKEEFKVYGLLCALAPTVMVQASSSGTYFVKLAKVLCAGFLNLFVVLIAHSLAPLIK